MKAWFNASYNPQGLKGLMATGGYAARRQAIEKLCNIMGVTLQDVTFTRGKYDIIVSFDAPNEEVALGVLVAVQSTDSFLEIVLSTELDIDAIVGHANKASPAYAPPGST